MVKEFRSKINEYGMLNTYKTIIGTLVAILLGIVAYEVKDIKNISSRALEKCIIVERNQASYEKYAAAEHERMKKDIRNNHDDIVIIKGKIQ